MRSLLALILACSVANAWADDCSDLAKRFAADRDALKIGELDDLKTCISDLEADKASGLVKSETPAYKNAPAQSGVGVPSAASAPVADPVSQPVVETPSSTDPVSQPIPDTATPPATPAGASQ